MYINCLLRDDLSLEFLQLSLFLRNFEPYCIEAFAITYMDMAELVKRALFVIYKLYGLVSIAKPKNM